MKKIPFISDKPVRVLYRIQCYDSNGEVIVRLYVSTKRRAEQTINRLRRKIGYDADLRKLRRSEWYLINPADIKREEK